MHAQIEGVKCPVSWLQTKKTMAPNASDRAVAQKLLFKIENVVTIGTACAGDAEHVLVTNQRHVICDESSRGVLMTELIAAYEAFAEGCEPISQSCRSSTPTSLSAPEKAVCFDLPPGRASLSRFGPTSIGVSTFDFVLQQLAGLGVDTYLVCDATFLDIEGIA